MKGRKAFSIFELSIVLAVMGVVCIPFLSLTSSIMDKNRYQITRKRLEVVRESVDFFFFKNGRYPCPAVLQASPQDQSYASESSANGTCLTLADIPNSSHSTKMSYGSVPADTLGISREYMFDGWGNKIDYSIVSNYSYDGTNLKYKIRFYNSLGAIVADNPSNTSETLNATTDDLDPESDYLIIKTTDSGSESTISTDAVYTLTSHGKDGFESYKRDGTQNPQAPNNTPDRQNSLFTNQGNTIDNIFDTKTKATGLNYDDDLVTYQTLFNLSHKLMEQNMIDCPAVQNVTSNYPVEDSSYNFTRSLGAGVRYPQNVITCPSDKPKITQNASYTCSKRGAWFGFVPQLCSYYFGQILTRYSGAPYYQNMLFWFDASDGDAFFPKSTSAVSVTNYYDKSPSGRADPSSVYSNISGVTRGINYKNGKSVATFSGTESYISLANLSLSDLYSNNISGFVVFRYNGSLTSRMAIIGSNTSSTGLGKVIAIDNRDGGEGSGPYNKLSYYDGTSSKSIHQISSNTWYLLSWNWDYSGPTFSAWLNKDLATVINANSTANAGSTTAIGSQYSQGGDYFQGDIAEVILYRGPMNDSERIQVESYLNSKWGLGLDY